MTRMAELERRLRGAETLQSVTGAMKAIAAARIRRSREAAGAAAAYHEVVERGLQAALRDAGPAAFEALEADPGGRSGLVVLGSNVGLAGPFNVALADFAADRAAEAAGEGGAPPLVLAVGARQEPLLEARGLPPDRLLAAPDTPESLPFDAREILVTLDGWRAAGVERIAILHQLQRSGISCRPQEVRLLPVSPAWLEGLRDRPWPTRQIPSFRTDRRRLISALVREHLLVTVVRALADATAAEHASRLSAMTAAESRVEEHLSAMRQAHAGARQAAVDAELLELTTGYEALEGEPGRRNDGTADAGLANPPGFGLG